MAFAGLQKKPSADLAVNWSNPITRNLNFCMLMTKPQGAGPRPGLRCLVNPARTITNNSSLLSLKAGRYGAEMAGMAVAAYLTISPTVAVSGGWTLSVITRFNATTGNAMLANNPGGAYNAYAYKDGAGNNLTSFDTGVRTFSPAIDVATEGNYHNLTITGNSSGANAYVDLNPVASTNAFNPTLAIEKFMNDSSSTSRLWSTTLLIMAWTRRLTQPEVLQLHRNRWGLFRPLPPQRRVYSEQTLAAFLARQGLNIPQAVNRASTY